MIDATDNSKLHRYEMVVDGWTAYVTYDLTDERIVLLHTLVPSALAGKGVGTALATAVLDDIRRRKLRVVPECPFIANFIARHPGFADLVESSKP
jgi:hypothetical protein